MSQVKMEMAVYTDKGAVREKNEDRILMTDVVYSEGGYHAKAGIPCNLAVCDGVGGYAGGEHAAQFVLEELSKQDVENMDSVEGVLEILEHVNRKLVHMKKNKNAYSNILTTVAGIAFTEHKIISYHAGDSRVYRLRGKYLSQITKDHSMAQEMIDCGMIKENQEEALAGCSTITRYLGEEMVAPPVVTEVGSRYLDGDLYMVCSDGIWSAIPFETLEEILTKKSTLSELAKEITEAALKGGSTDNLSVCLAKVVTES